MSNERKIEALKGATERKRQSALDKTNQAINILVKKGNSITFTSVAKEAGVSTAYLYKYDELKKRIQQLQQQQQAQPKSQSPQIASDKSKQVILNQLRERIKKLETENRDLRDQTAIIYGQLSMAQSRQADFDKLQFSNAKLQAENRQLQEQISSCQSRLASSTSTLEIANQPNAEIILLADKRQTKAAIDESIQSALSSLGVKLNSTLSKVIKSAPKPVVLNAITALKEAISSGRIERPGGWLKTAIEAQWIPNESLETSPTLANTSQATFREWYDLAKAYGVIKAFREEDGVTMVQENGGQWYSYEDYVARGWTIDYFRGWKSRQR